MREARAALGAVVAIVTLLVSSCSASHAATGSATSGASPVGQSATSSPVQVSVVASSTASSSTGRSSTAAPSTVRAGRGGYAAIASSTPVHRRLVGLGDSVPAGAACNCTNFVIGAAQRLSRSGHPVVAVNLAVGGATSTSLLRTLTTARARSVVAGSDVVLMEIGANDFDASRLDDPACLGALTCWAPTLRQLVVNLRGILATLHRLRPAQPVVVVVLGYWNIARSGAVGAAGGSVFVRNARALSDRVNRLEREAAAAAGGVYVDTYRAFGSDDRAMTGLLAADGDHPNARGHAVLAAAVVAALHAAGR